MFAVLIDALVPNAIIIHGEYVEGTGSIGSGPAGLVWLTPAAFACRGALCSVRGCLACVVICNRGLYDAPHSFKSRRAAVGLVQVVEVAATHG